MKTNNDTTRKPTTQLPGALPSAAVSGCGDGLKLWRADRTEIKLVNCPRGAWPEADEDGKIAYENTHFKTPEEAWRKVERENEAHIELTLSAINRLNNWKN